MFEKRRAVLAAAFFFLAVAARAARVHPTSARLAGLLLAAGTLALVAVATWTGVVAPLRPCSTTPPRTKCVATRC